MRFFRSLAGDRRNQPQRLSATSLIGRLARSLSRSERRLIALFAAAALVAASLLVLRSATTLLTQGRETKYIEGIVASSPADVDPTVTALTKASLIRSDATGTLAGALAESWQVSDDAKRFDFQLRTGVNREVILQALDPTAPNSPTAGAEVQPFDARGIRIQLPEPFRPLLSELTKPLIPLGPYLIGERLKEKVTLVARPDYFEGKPLIEQLVIAIYPTLTALQQAVDHHQVDAVADATNLTLPASFTRYTLGLPRKTAAFFNLDRELLQPLDVRQKLSERRSFPSPIDLRVVTTDRLASRPAITQLLTDWKRANVRVALEVLSPARVEQEVLPSRDYDVVIYGIDLGPEADPYPFWHSSQRKASGLNLANFANVDADHAIEAARKTGNTDEYRRLQARLQTILDAQRPWFVIDDTPFRFAVRSTVRGPANHASFVPTDRYLDLVHWTVGK